MGEADSERRGHGKNVREKALQANALRSGDPSGGQPGADPVGGTRPEWQPAENDFGQENQEAENE